MEKAHCTHNNFMPQMLFSLAFGSLSGTWCVGYQEVRGEMKVERGEQGLEHRENILKVEESVSFLGCINITGLF